MLISWSKSKEREVAVFGLGPTELVILIVVALIVFGPSRLPKVGKMLGETMGNFKKMKDVTGDVQTKVKKDIENMILGPPSNN
jgi:TatA/E family protein of Tat protein translocase